MNLYADTSALVKRYVRETGTDRFIAQLDQVELVGVSAVTPVEMASAISKAARLGWVDELSAAAAWEDFLSDWHAYLRLPLTTGVVERASVLTWRYGLRAYDAIHLASALMMKDVTAESVRFACFDQRLSQAAVQEGLPVWPEPGS